MKKTLRRMLAMTTLLAVLLSTTTVFAEDTPDTTTYKEGNGSYTVTVSNADTTGISIAGNTFHAFQIFAADDVTSYSVTKDFRAFFAGTLTGDDGQDYNFQQYLVVIDTYEDPDVLGTALSTTGNEDLLKFETALDNYNQLAGAYMDSYENNMYALSVQFRNYLDTYGAYAVADGIECMAHATAAAANEDGYELASLVGLYTGYYFIFDQNSTMNGLGIAASGAFVPLVSGDEYNTTISVKDSVPTMTKNIYHDDAGKWDIVGDSQIGDTVEFRIFSTMPSNITQYIKDEESNSNAINTYTYILTDVMSEGLTYDGNIKIYTDAEKQNELDAQYYTLDEDDTNDSDETFDFKVTVDVIELLTADSTIATLYIYYSATLNSDAAVASDYDTNTATLKYSNNPYESDQFGTTESTVTHFTFGLDVTKLDESNNGLAGARFGLFDVEGNPIPLGLDYIDYATGIVYYTYDESVAVIADGGYITTQAVELTDGSNIGETVTGKFVINGLDDATTYTLQEVEAPQGYNTADQFDFYFIVTYDATGTEITHFTDGSAYVNTSTDNSGDWSSSATIINRLKIYLPTTGGMGTVLFRVGGGALMLGAVYMLYVSHRKKENEDSSSDQ